MYSQSLSAPVLAIVLRFLPVGPLLGANPYKPNTNGSKPSIALQGLCPKACHEAQGHHAREGLLVAFFFFFFGGGGGVSDFGG